MPSRFRTFGADLLAQSCETLRQLRSPEGRRAWRAELKALKDGLVRAPWLWHAGVHGPALDRCLEHWSHVRPNAAAISDENESLDWSSLNDRVHSWAATLSDLGITDGERVALVAENSVNLVVALFAIRARGGIVLLLDPRSSRDWQLEALSEFSAKWLVYGEVADGESLAPKAHCRAVGFAELSLRKPRSAPQLRRRRHTHECDPFVVLATSGTTGKPKQVPISNARCVLSGFGIAGLCLALTRNDALHCVLPLSHATAFMTALCPTFVAGCHVVLRRRFSVTEFWSDVAAQPSTHLLYVGELVRMLLSAPLRPNENEHRLRVAYGNGMSLDVWQRFRARFGIARVFEYYGATELPLALVNLAGEPGFVGRTPLGKLSPWRIVTRDDDTGELARDADGICIGSPATESGELVLLNSWFGKTALDAQDAGAGQHMRLVHDVANAGDIGLRTGDIVRRDSNGYVRFEDRTFEIFRQAGRNVSTTRVTKLLRGFDGVADVGVTHLTLQNYDGQLGLAVIVPASDFDIDSLAQSCGKLASFEQPRFVRLTHALRLNRSYKFDHAFYRRAGVSPDDCDEPTFVFRRGAFEVVTAEIWAGLATGQLRFQDGGGQSRP